MSAVPEQVEQPQGGLNQASAAPPANPTLEAESAPINLSKTEDPIAAQMEKYRVGRQKLDEQINRLQQSLESRKNLPFNPMYLDIARAASTPSSTGSAIQGLGRIGGAYGDAYEKEQVRQQGLSQDQLALEQKRFDLLKADLGQQAMYQFATGKFGANQSAQPEQSAENAPPAGSNSKTSVIIPAPDNLPPANTMRRVTDQDIALMGSLDPAAGEALTKLSKLQREALIQTNEGVWNSMTQNWDVLFSMPIERPVRVLGKVAMTKAVSQQYDAMMAKLDKGDATEEQKDLAVAEFAAQNGLGGVTKIKGKTGLDAYSNFTDPQSQQLDVTQKTERLKSREKENDADRSMLNMAGQNAQAQIQAANTLYNLSTSPSTSGAFGVLRKPGVVNAIAVAAAEYLSKGSFGTAGIEDAVRQARGSPAEIRAASIAAQAQGQLMLMASQAYLKGQGSVSDAERRLVANLTGSLSDVPEAMAMKAKVVEAHARYMKQVSDAYYDYEKSNPSATVQDFYRQSRDYKDLFNAYDKHMTSLYSHYFPNTGNAPSSAPAAPKPAAPAGSANGLTPKVGTPIGPLQQRILDQKRALQ
jgi:hypothetical protein